MARARRGVEAHPERKEIARYLLSRGREQLESEGSAAAPLQALAATSATKKAAFAFPAGLEPVPVPIAPVPDPSLRLPRADVVVITWTVDEVAALAHVLTPGVSPANWHKYSRGFQSKYASQIRPGAPAGLSRRLAATCRSRLGRRGCCA